jgi:hypothetical protein
VTIVAYSLAHSSAASMLSITAALYAIFYSLLLFHYPHSLATQFYKAVFSLVGFLCAFVFNYTTAALLCPKSILFLLYGTKST